jgi:hypothetical protein
MTKKLYDYDVGENVSLFVLIKTSETRNHRSPLRNRNKSQ